MRPACKWRLPALPVLTYVKYLRRLKPLQVSPLYEGYGRRRPVLGSRHFGRFAPVFDSGSA
ncbi:MAG: hypothetical protein E5X48_20880 [Mesorhizobium sp.]|nr:MAG: hypothetical protein E5X48_20880 [Mesorhizobium sp.]